MNRPRSGASVTGAKPAPARRRRWVMFALVVAPLLFAELLARGVTWAPPVDRVPRVRAVFSEATLGDWLPNQVGISTVRPETAFQVHINDAGFRNVDPLASDGLRVLVLGDSQTFGQYVSTHDIWTRIAQRRFNVDHPERRVQLLNNGMPGATIADYIDYLKEKGERLAPDVVLIVIYVNDVSDLSVVGGAVRSRLKREAEGVRFRPLRAFLGAHSGLYNVARSLKEAMLSSPAKARDIAAARPVGSDGSADGLAFRKLAVEAVALARAMGAAVGMIYVGDHRDGDPRPREISLAVATELGVPSLDLHAVYARHLPEDVFLIDPLGAGDDYPSDGHLSRYGHRVTGFAVAEFLATVIPGAPS